MAKRRYESQRYETRWSGLPDDDAGHYRVARDGAAERERREFDSRLDFRPVSTIFPLKSRLQKKRRR